jgi:hypothetical protein
VLNVTALVLGRAGGRAPSRWFSHAGVTPRFDRPKVGHATNNRAFTGIPSIALASRGRLWAVWYPGVTLGKDMNGYVVFSTSGDNGET